MKVTSRLLVALFILPLLMLTACGGAPSVGLADIPTYPSANALQPGENPIADSLAKNVSTAGQMGQKLDQKVFTLPKDASWDQVKSFYDEKLSGAGWQNQSLPIPSNDAMQLSIWTRGSQSLTVARMVEPVNSDSFMIFSLASQ